MGQLYCWKKKLPERLITTQHHIKHEILVKTGEFVVHCLAV